ncbi:MAG: gamma-glutamylcyclotransferase family protein [Patescibacteria group bacterium]|nr:gamma-glutamylcyclotransferase family protein [Patescibacteria group bacterium]
MNFVKIFVYGTLKLGGHYSKQFDKYRCSSEPAILYGTLFNAGRFPALIKKGNNIIYGEVHKYKKPEIILPAIDHIEGFISKESKMNLYIREKVKILPKYSNECLAYVYFFTRSIKKMKYIKNGEWKI